MKLNTWMARKNKGLRWEGGGSFLSDAVSVCIRSVEISPGNIWKMDCL